MQTNLVVETGPAALLFATIFVTGSRVHPFRTLIRDRRNIISFSAGMSVAYVFVHLMPELDGARRRFATSAFATLRFEGMAIYFIALVGFLFFYGINHLGARLQGGIAIERERRAFRFHVGGFALYVWLVAYLLVRKLEETAVSIAFYATAMAFHFLAVNDGLHREHGLAYEHIGRFVLAGMSIVGWSVGMTFALPVPVLAVFVALVSSAIIMTSVVMELASETDGRFFPVVSGGLTYGLILLPLA